MMQEYKSRFRGARDMFCLQEKRDLATSFSATPGWSGHLASAQYATSSSSTPIDFHQSGRDRNFAAGAEQHKVASDHIGIEEDRRTLREARQPERGRIDHRRVAAHQVCGQPSRARSDAKTMAAETGGDG
jgi:hypothetical protein